MAVPDDAPDVSMESLFSPAREDDEDSAGTLDEGIDIDDDSPPSPSGRSVATVAIGAGHLVNQRGLQQRLLKLLRPLAKGPGLRIRSCVLCKCVSNSRSPVLNESFRLWAYMEPDGVTIIGYVDQWCYVVMRMAYKGFKQSDLELLLAESPQESARFNKLLAGVIKKCLADPESVLSLRD